MFISTCKSASVNFCPIKKNESWTEGNVMLVVCLFQDVPRVLVSDLVSDCWRGAWAGLTASELLPSRARSPRWRDELQSRSSCCHSFIFCAKKGGVHLSPGVWNSSWLFDAFLDFVCLNIPTFDRLLTPILILIVPSTFCRDSKRILHVTWLDLISSLWPVPGSHM